jgi:hypothetical protein
MGTQINGFPFGSSKPSSDENLKGILLAEALASSHNHLQLMAEQSCVETNCCWSG